MSDFLSSMTVTGSSEQSAAHAVSLMHEALGCSWTCLISLAEGSPGILATSSADSPDLLRSSMHDLRKSLESEDLTSHHGAAVLPLVETGPGSSECSEQWLLGARPLSGGPVILALHWAEGQQVPTGPARERLASQVQELALALTVRRLQEELLTRGKKTELEAQEEDAVDLLARERRLFTDGPCIIFRWRATEGWPVEYVSPNVVNFFGHTAEDFLTGKVPYATVVHPEDLQRVGDEVESHSEAGVSTFEQEYRIVRPDGEVRWLYDHTVVHREGGEITHYEGYVLDATERVVAAQERLTLETQVQQAQKLEGLGLLAGGIAHDFNNLLMGILGYADLALETLSPESTAAKDIEGIRKAARNAADLTHQLLAYSGKGRFVLEAVNVNLIIEEMGRLLTVSTAHSVELRIDLAEDLPLVEADAAQLQQVIMNLLTNASEAIDKTGGVVSVRTGTVEPDVGSGEQRPPHTQVCIEVTDTGTGMDVDTLEKIFDPFFTTKFTGRGLGLAAVQGIVTGHGGTMSVESEPGKGTTFRLMLPASVTTKTSALAPTIHGSAARMGGRILVVDDEDTVRDVAEHMLSRSGYQVLTADGGREALTILTEQGIAIDCVLLDLTMPGMGGEATLRGLRAEFPTMPVLLSSGFDEQDVSQLLAQDPASGFIQKPYERPSLLQALKDLLGDSAPA